MSDTFDNRMSNMSTISSISVNPIFRVVIAGVPMRIPEGSSGFLVSNGTIFLLTLIPISSNAVSVVAQDMDRDCTMSTRKRCVSVHPETIEYPRSVSFCEKYAALSIVDFAYSRKAGVDASAKASAFAAIVCSWGQPCIPGKTARASAGAKEFFDMIIAHLGQRRVLCVVVVTISQRDIGLSSCPPAIKPAVWEISPNKIAPTSSAIQRKDFQSISLEYAEKPAIIIFG